MRISTIKNDPGYLADAHTYNVFMDGKKVHNCITADEEIGIVITIPFKWVEDLLKTTMKEGRVMIIHKDELYK